MYCSAKIDHTKPLSATILPAVESLLLTLGEDAVTEEQDIIVYLSVMEDTVTAATRKAEL